MVSYRTPYSRVKGLGSARSGTEHFWAQRLTAVANIVLLIFLIYSVIRLAGEPLDAVRAYFASPLVAILASLFAISAAFHMRIGMQVIIEDYVHDESAKLTLLMANSFFTIVVGLACAYGVLKLSFGV